MTPRGGLLWAGVVVVDWDDLKWLIGFLFAGPLAWLWRKIAGVEKSLAALDKSQADHRLHVSENYMKSADVKAWMADSKADFSRTLDEVRKSLGRIEDKLDRKADK